MESFSEKSLISLGDFYVYGLIDPRTNQFFYIGKGKGKAGKLDGLTVVSWTADG